MSQVGASQKAIEQDAEVEGSTLGGDASVQTEVRMGVDALEAKPLGQNGKDRFDDLPPGGQGVLGGCRPRLGNRVGRDTDDGRGIQGQLLVEPALTVEATVGEVGLTKGRTDRLQRADACDGWV